MAVGERFVLEKSATVDASINGVASDNAPVRDLGNPDDQPLRHQPISTTQHLLRGLPGCSTGNDYMFGELCGTGAMGSVRQATHKPSGRTVAIKTLRPELLEDERMVARFIQEQQIQRQIHHPNVVEVFDLISHSGGLGIVMEYVALGDLESLANSKSLPIVDRVRIVAEIATGLEAIHEQYVVHRDLKPANILMVNRDGQLHPKITDLGVSRLLSEGTTKMTSAVGTPRYMAPESISPTGTKASGDIYSLGVMLFEQLVNETPFTGPTAVAVLKAHTDDEPPSIHGIPKTLSSLLDQMLSKDPSSRPTATEVKQQLEQILPLINDETRPEVLEQGTTIFDEPVAVEPTKGSTSIRDRFAPDLNLVATVGVILLLLVAGVISFTALRSETIDTTLPEPSEISDQLVFEPVLVNEQVLVERRWIVREATLTSRTVLTNLGEESINFDHYEALPNELRSIENVTFNRSPTNVAWTPNGHEALFSIVGLRPGASVTINYSASISGEVNLDEVAAKVRDREQSTFNLRAEQDGTDLAAAGVDLEGEGVNPGSGLVALPETETNAVAAATSTVVKLTTTSTASEVTTAAEVSTTDTTTEVIDTATNSSTTAALTTKPTPTTKPTSTTKLTPTTKKATTTKSTTTTTAPRMVPAQPSKVKLNPVVFLTSRFETGVHGQVTEIQFRYTYTPEDYAFHTEPKGLLQYNVGETFRLSGRELGLGERYTVFLDPALKNKSLARREVCIEIARKPSARDASTFLQSNYTKKCETVLSGSPQS